MVAQLEEVDPYEKPSGAKVRRQQERGGVVVGILVAGYTPHIHE
jgi:hypothetical protein